MLSASLILLVGCRHQSGFDLLVSGMSSAKAIQSEYVIHSKRGKDVSVSFLYSRPGRFLVSSQDFKMVTNEVDGYYETIPSQKLYDSLPFDGQTYPGTGKLVNPSVINGGPVCASNPNDIFKGAKWVFKGKKGNEETYSKVVATAMGNEEYALVVNDKGFPVKFSSPAFVFETKSFEYLDEQPISKFLIEPRDGDVCIRTTSDRFSLENGKKFDISQLQASPDSQNFKFDGEILFGIINPQEPTSQNAIGWLHKAGAGYRKVSISRGKATTGLYDPTGSIVDKMTTTTPTFVLVGKDGKVQGLWMGFDSAGVAEFEKDIQKAIEGKE